MEDLRKGYKVKLMREANECACICEQLRMVYDIVHEFQDQELKATMTELLVDAFMMVKKMHDRLAYYRDRYEPSKEVPNKLRHLPGREERLAKRRQRKVL